MMDHEFNECWNLLASLWPRRISRLTGEQKDTYKRVMDRYRTTQVVPVIRGLAEVCDRMPTPAVIRSNLKASRRKEIERCERDTTRDAERAEYRSMSEKIDAVIDDMTDDQLGHVRSVLVDREPFLEVAYVGETRESWPWKVLVYDWVVKNGVPDKDEHQ